MNLLFCRAMRLPCLAVFFILCLWLPDAQAQCGKASWYALKGMTASGQPMDAEAMTAAHRSLPFGSRVEVLNKNNGKRVVVQINDRGPFVNGRVIDVSRAAAAQLGFIRNGHTHVCLRKIR